MVKTNWIKKMLESPIHPINKGFEWYYDPSVFEWKTRNGEDMKNKRLELKTGDKVLLKSLQECLGTRPKWTEGMHHLAGNVVTVKTVGSTDFEIVEGGWYISMLAVEKKVDASELPTPKDDFELLFGFAD